MRQNNAKKCAKCSNRNKGSLFKQLNKELYRVLFTHHSFINIHLKKCFHSVCCCVLLIELVMRSCYMATVFLKQPLVCSRSIRLPRIDNVAACSFHNRCVCLCARICPHIQFLLISNNATTPGSNGYCRVSSFSERDENLLNAFPN